MFQRFYTIQLHKDFTIFNYTKMLFWKGEQIQIWASFRGSVLTEAGHKIVNFLAKGNWFTLDFSPVLTLGRKKGTAYFQSNFMKFTQFLEEKTIFDTRNKSNDFLYCIQLFLDEMNCCWSTLCSNLANGMRLDYLGRKRESLSKSAGNGNWRTSFEGKEGNWHFLTHLYQKFLCFSDANNFIQNSTKKKINNNLLVDIDNLKLIFH